MPHPSRIYPRDEELGKRDDDHKPAKPSQWQSWRGPLRYRKRRLGGFIAVAFLVWLFVHYIPDDLGSIDSRIGRPLRPGHENAFGQNAQTPQQPVGPPPKPKDEDRSEELQHYYNGPIRFYKLAASLHATARTMGHRPANRNILFAASSLKSASMLIPMACEMARWDRNYVHMSFMGRHELSIDEILEVNGVDKNECFVYWHDARPDYVDYSSDVRMEISVSAALTHINTFVHPQVVIMDDSLQEDVFFVKGIRSGGKKLERAIIELPQDGLEKMMWMTRLDSGSLTAWHIPSIDILVHAPLESSGSLIRLLRSLESADYAGFPAPRLTIELPSHVDLPTQRFLERFTWPPNQEHLSQPTNKLILRHHIPDRRATAEEASVRFLESFYPSTPSDSHVLLLSAQTELSPLYYHYLIYTLLEYRYSAYSAATSDSLLGIALDVPSTHLNGSTPLTIPTTADMHDGGKYQTAPADTSAPFLWQAPDADAALYFGDKWLQLHAFLAARIAAQHDDATTAPPPQRTKQIAPTQPAWMEYALELMRARGWSVLYPAMPAPNALATVHTDLYQPPEEFARSPESRIGTTPASEELPDVSEPFLPAPSAPAASPQPEPPLLSATRPLHALLPFAADLPELAHLPLLSHTGTLLSPGDSDTAASAFAAAFRKEIGGCAAGGKGRERRLFCRGDEEEAEDDDDDEVVAAENYWTAKANSNPEAASGGRRGGDTAGDGNDAVRAQEGASPPGYHPDDDARAGADRRADEAARAEPGRTGVAVAAPAGAPAPAGAGAAGLPGSDSTGTTPGAAGPALGAAGLAAGAGLRRPKPKPHLGDPNPADPAHAELHRLVEEAGPPA